MGNTGLPIDPASFCPVKFNDLSLHVSTLAFKEDGGWSLPINARESPTSFLAASLTAFKNCIICLFPF
jgi:hypothetical protein